MMRTRTFGQCALGCLAIAALSLPLTGCLVVADSHESFTGKGAAPPAGAVGQIEPGETTKAKVMDLLGEPSHKQSLEKGEVLYRWDYGKRTEKQVAVFLLLACNDQRSSETRVYAMVKDDVVTKTWTERSSH